jgi:hypothetical protein
VKLVASRPAPPKRRLTFNGLHGTTQKTEVFLTTAVRTSNPLREYVISLAGCRFRYFLTEIFAKLKKGRECKTQRRKEKERTRVQNTKKKGKRKDEGANTTKKGKGARQRRDSKTKIKLWIKEETCWKPSQPTLLY